MKQEIIEVIGLSHGQSAAEFKTDLEFSVEAFFDGQPCAIPQEIDPFSMERIRSEDCGRPVYFSVSGQTVEVWPKPSHRITLFLKTR